LVQKLAGTDLDDNVIADLERRMSADLHLTDRLARGESTDEIARFLQGSATGHGLLTTRPLQFQCTCSRDKMAATVASLGEAELRRIKEETGHLEVRCPYCADVQTFKLEELIQH
jgi:molecular chaperone Hsp33